MNQDKYIGMDVHAATISAAVMNAEGARASDRTMVCAEQRVVQEG